MWTKAPHSLTLFCHLFHRALFAVTGMVILATTVVT